MSKTEAVICFTIGGIIYNSAKWAMGLGFNADALFVGTVFFTAAMLLIYYGLVKP